jgi:hypothetical protein
VSESEGIDARWRHERRGAGIRAGRGFGVAFLAFKVIERTGILAPILGADLASGGPFTVRWAVAVLGSALLGAVFFGLAMQWTVPPPRRHPTDA